ncbi:hypothetical protein F4820DRAFT_452219 [Hypoxylon rubiginosum]|uniref:Uncharacterized protein n=1 Tax=Hypoxylon rubiginosum TaxID=110542 RepID=A0ACB9YP58_9PEZI|nr:hypothetical protein F4820DRAFT_452219 [Hypoxylon rubiginosum]
MSGAILQPVADYDAPIQLSLTEASLKDTSYECISYDRSSPEAVADVATGLGRRRRAADPEGARKRPADVPAQGAAAHALGRSKATNHQRTYQAMDGEDFQVADWLGRKHFSVDVSKLVDITIV